MVRHNKRRTHLYVRWASKRAAYIPNNIFVSKWMGLYPEGLKTWGGGGAFNVGLYGMRYWPRVWSIWLDSTVNRFFLSC